MKFYAPWTFAVKHPAWRPAKLQTVKLAISTTNRLPSGAGSKLELPAPGMSASGVLDHRLAYPGRRRAVGHPAVMR